MDAIHSHLQAHVQGLRIVRTLEDTAHRSDIIGRRGPKPAPTAIKIARGTESRRINHAEPRPPAGLPEPPEWLSPASRAKWDALIPVLASTRMLTVLDGDILVQYVTTWEQWKRHLDLVQKGLDVIVMRDEAGRLRYTQVGPSATLVRRYGEQLHRIAQQFGMTPSSRSSIRVGDSPTIDDPLAQFLKKYEA